MVYIQLKRKVRIVRLIIEEEKEGWILNLVLLLILGIYSVIMVFLLE